MATELWFPGVKAGWLSGFGTGDYRLSAELDGVDIAYIGPDAAELERAFYRAAMRTLLRRWLPWIRPPVPERHLRQRAR